MALTLLLLAALGAIFFKGFKEAIGVAVVLVAIYLALNTIVVAVALAEVLKHPHLIRMGAAAMETTWQHSGNIGVSLILFPKLALGLSGFETGVAVMPLISGDRVRNTKKLLGTAALIMSVFLIASSFVTSILIEPKAFESGGPANGRAGISGAPLSGLGFRHYL